MLQIRDLLFGLIVEAISQASVNRMSQTHWEPRQEVKEGENCFVSEQNCQLRLQTMPNKYSITNQ